MSAAVLAAAVALSPVTPIADAAHAPANVAPFEACVAERESHRNPRVVNSSGHAGMYQFAPPWRHGLPWMVRDRLVRFGMKPAQARSIRLRLAAMPIHHWPARMQRIGFLEVVARGGAEHWYLAGSRCNTLAPRGAR